MRAVIQRVRYAEVIVDGQSVSQIHQGILTLLGIKKKDSEAQLQKLIQKICDLRIFEDPSGKMNLSLREVKGQHLIVSQFTLLADCAKGRRPSFLEAEDPDKAKDLYEKALEISQKMGVPTLGGIFQAHMDLRIHNDGPVTILLES